LAAPEIALDITPLQNAHRYRGIGTYVRGLAGRLAQQSDIPIEFWGWGPDVPISPPAPHTTQVLRRIPMPQYRGAWLFAQLAMRRRTQRSKVRAVHITDPDALVPLAGRKLLTTVYDLIPLKQGMRGQRMIARSGYRAYVRSLARADTLFAISAETAADLVDMVRIPAGRITIARPGVDLPPSSGRPIGRTRPYFLYVGGPNPNKNLSLLLDAMAGGSDGAEELRVGGHWLPKQVAALDSKISLAGLRERVRFIGFVEPGELADLMRDATAVVVPSLHEGFGLPVAEAMAAGGVVVHSRLPVLEETSAGAALTFDPHSVDELAACLRRVAQDPKLVADLRKRGLERAKQLTWDEAVSATLAAYAAILSR
jgi:glycosyltransferase involved in cell wall biosynthesis